MAITNDDWNTVLFGFEYISHLERTSEASISEIARLDSIRLFMADLHITDSLKLVESRRVRLELESKFEEAKDEVRRQRRAKIWGSIGAFLSGTGFGALLGWVASR